MRTRPTGACFTAEGDHEKMIRGGRFHRAGGVMTRVSEYYSLGRTQGTLDFVDVDTVNDIRVYVDPSSIRYLEDDWGKQCLRMLETFFDSVLDSVRSNDKRRTVSLLSQLRFALLVVPWRVWHSCVSLVSGQGSLPSPLPGYGSGWARNHRCSR